MANLKIDTTVDLQLQNWNNFCQYHAGENWHGIWTRYSPDGKAIQSFKSIRSFSLNDDGNEIIHQNYYTYADGKTESKNISSYIKPDTTLLFLGKSFSVLFLDNSYSWGNTEISANAPFGFEIGFRDEDKRASASVIYNQNGTINYITVIPENLVGFTEESSVLSGNELSRERWSGQGKSILPNLTTTEPVATTWTRLEDLNKDYLTLHFQDGISLSSPHQLESGNEFCLVVDWLVHPTLLYRGTRHFDTAGFSCFTLEVFTQDK
ncbi:hypothetical protein WA1_12360 [Scytonema hofmannii PCC 7110]|uniref:Uncharacterized protein n=1 Tax=Scytonema hofmannii PCC 7110 TaxID=128403 RepID=A0A139XDY0_9CYAN|nr:DUF3598 family protein [Scytonema hofmannii]KYC42904.1 hypothetical protein WA1_12360 [Scytonema hofmannii PCC 7110]